MELPTTPACLAPFSEEYAKRIDAWLAIPQGADLYAESEQQARYVAQLGEMEAGLLAVREATKRLLDEQEKLDDLRLKNLEGAHEDRLRKSYAATYQKVVARLESEGGKLPTAAVLKQLVEADDDYCDCREAVRQERLEAQPNAELTELRQHLENLKVQEARVKALIRALEHRKIALYELRDSRRRTARQQSYGSGA